MSESFLVNTGFLPVGSWRAAACRPHKAAWLRSQPGLYAFVIEHTVMYVGETVTLHRRLRNYGNRAFRNGNNAQRKVHVGIASSTAENIEVAIFARVVPGADKELLLPMQNALIQALQPPWNGTIR
ncbi:MAG: hypothetical protein GEV13_00085 [Rhodospirillales bacterium]|nr:hypothetical protein [Rhodospirillales bacterium]